jgi:hypothetical protein
MNPLSGRAAIQRALTHRPNWNEFQLDAVVKEDWKGSKDHHGRRSAYRNLQVLSIRRSVGRVARQGRARARERAQPISASALQLD